MATIWALEEGRQESLQHLGDVQLLAEYDYKTLKAKKKVNTSVGAYKQTMKIPYYKNRHIKKWRETPRGMGARFLGVVAKGDMTKGKEALAGYICRQEDSRNFCLPVAPQKNYRSAAWKVNGYIVVNEGCVGIAKRRWVFWTVLLLLSLAVFGVTYQMFRLDLDIGEMWAMLLESIKDLPRTLSNFWYFLWNTRY